MGLAASQARLLTITSRKSDCEYDSMSLSHQKIALARDMNIVSAEYQDALNQTKLVYDFYGNGDTSTDFTYGLMMTPSSINNYMPIPLTDPSGRIVLDAKLAAAAEAAGIPQEGLGCTPSSDIRNKFIEGLIDTGLITRTVGNNVKGVQYNPTMGIGTVDIVTTYTKAITFDEFIEEYLSDIKVDLSGLLYNAGGSSYKLINHNSESKDTCDYHKGSKRGNLSPTVSIKDLLDGNYALYGSTWDQADLDSNTELGGRNCAIDKVGSCSFWDELFDTLGSVINPNDYNTVAALDYAKQQTLQKVVSMAITPALDTSNAAKVITSNGSGGFLGMGKTGNSQDKMEELALEYSEDYVGYVYLYNYGQKASKGFNDAYNINLTNMTKAFYTYFAQYMQGFTKTDLKVTNTKDTSEFITDGTNANEFTFNVLDEVDTTGDNMLIAGFYDALFNQIATKGWVKNENVTDKDYMQTMLKNGCMYISSVADDNYYYMANYSTNTYIKEVTDEEFIAKAEAKYQREKAKINSKENILDMKMKNLDTEISALTTEYETVKSVIANGAKNAFTRYEA